MRRAALIGLGALVVGLACRRRFRRQLSEAVRLPVAVLVAVLVAPFDILDDAWGAVTGIAGNVKDWVLGVVHHLQNMVGGWIDDVWAGLSSVGRWVSDLFQSAIDFAGSLVNAVYGFVSTAVGDVIRWVGEGIDAVYGFARHLFDTIVRWAEDAVGAVWDWLGGLVKWIWDNVVTPLWDAIQWVWHNVVEPAIDWLAHLIGDVWDWLRGAWKAITQWISDLWDWVWKYAARLLGVVEKAFDWLVMLALHGPAWIVKQVTDFFRHAPEWLAHELASTIAKEGPSIEQTFADWLK